MDWAKLGLRVAVALERIADTLDRIVIDPSIDVDTVSNGHTDKEIAGAQRKR